jgi:hypothetical protein
MGRRRSIGLTSDARTTVARALVRLGPVDRHTVGAFSPHNCQSAQEPPGAIPGALHSLQPELRGEIPLARINQDVRLALAGIDVRGRLRDTRPV